MLMPIHLLEILEVCISQYRNYWSGEMDYTAIQALVSYIMILWQWISIINFLINTFPQTPYLARKW